MDWSTATSWWIVTGVLVAAELATGTFYLLMLALGAAAAALGAHLGLGFNGQLLAAALIGGGAVIAWHFKRRAEPQALPAGENRDVNLDIGETVHVGAWDVEGGAQVSYRGATGRRVTQAKAHRSPVCTASTPSTAAACCSTPCRNPTELPIRPKEAPMELVFIIVLIIAAIFVARSLKVVPQQHAWVVERLGKYHGTLTPGLNILIPFIDRVAYRHSLKEIPLDVPSQVCITKDNTQLTVDGILYFQVTDPMRASYGASNYVIAITQLAQTTLRSVIGKMELDKTFEERTSINTAVVHALDEAAQNWGVKVLRYEIKDLTPPAAILHSMQAQITAEREKRALIAASEGRRQEQINIATGEREAFIARSEGEKQAEINNAQGQASAIVAVAEANAEAIRKVAQAIREPGGEQAVQLKVAEKAVEAYSQLAQKNNTMIVPGNMSEVSGLIATAMAIINKGQTPSK